MARQVPDAPVPDLIDYRVTGWGHTISLRRCGEHESGAPLFSGHLFSGFRKPKVGTGVIVKMASQRDAVFELTEVEWCRDPSDMYFFKAFPVRYLDGKP